MLRNVMCRWCKHVSYKQISGVDALSGLLLAIQRFFVTALSLDDTHRHIYQQSRCARSTQKKLQATIGFSAYLSVGIVNRHSMTTLILTIRRENKLNEFVTSCVCTLWQLACGVKPWMLKHDSGDMNLAAGCCDMVPKTWTLKVML